MLVVILELLKALNIVSNSRWTLEFDEEKILLKEWDRDIKNYITSAEIKHGASNYWEAGVKELIQLAIVREATPAKGE